MRQPIIKRTCAGCGDPMYRTVHNWECTVCHQWPLCQVCRILHEEHGQHMKEPTND